MISYNPLWHTLLDRGMNKGDLKDATGLSYGTMASMGKNEPVNLMRSAGVPIEALIEYVKLLIAASVM